MNQRFNHSPDRKGSAQSRSEKTSVRFLKFKLAVLIVLCALPVYGVIAYALRGGSWLALAVYPVMSLLAFGLYGHDKKQARLQGARTPEKLLHGLEVLGGWPGALLAQQVFRHKTRKVSYQLMFWLIVSLHELYWLDRVLLGGNFLARHFY
ncbi:DUF1294 domain-containing protein [Pseudomonas sp. Pseu.R1]|uniref:DUF1294 domain-containing protein n=1 Tax=Pseudomonas sp. Pseu.R1 TaxID=3379818 RepID=UPI003B93CE2E